MKADLYIGGDVRSVVLVAPPLVSEWVTLDGRELQILRIAHDCDKQKLQLFCGETEPSETEGEQTAHAGIFEPLDREIEDTDMEIE
jgi:hypothetical protein